MKAFEKRIYDAAKSKFKLGTTAYSIGFKHPTLNNWAVEVEVNDSPEWLEIETELNPNDINNLIDFSSDWFITIYT